MADVSKLSIGLVNGLQRNVDLASNTLVVDNLKLKLAGSNYATFAGTLTGNRTITIPDADVNLGYIANLISLSGVAAGSTDLGTFTGTTIADNSTIKSALQALETYIETVAGTSEFLDNAFRIKDDGDDTKEIAFEASAIATGTTRTISMPDENVNLAHVGTAYDTLGVTDGATNLGSFSGTIIADNNTVKQALQSLETYSENLSSLINNFEWQESALSIELDSANIVAPSTGDRYLIAGTGLNDFATHDNKIAEWNGSAWVFTSPSTGMYISVDDESDGLYLYGGSSWSKKYFEATTASTGLVKVGFDIRLDSSAAGDGLGFSSGVLSVNVDNSTIEINSDTLRIKDGAITFAKLNAAVITGATAETSVDDADLILIHDDSANALRKMTRANFLAGYELDGIVMTMTAGEAFAANTSFLVRLAVNGETAERIYKADKDGGAQGSENHNYYVWGILMSTSALSAGDPASVRVVGMHTLGSSDSTFSASDIGKPVFLTDSGAFSLTPPTGTNVASVIVGQVFNTNKIMIHADKKPQGFDGSVV